MKAYFLCFVFKEAQGACGEVVSCRGLGDVSCLVAGTHSSMMGTNNGRPGASDRNRCSRAKGRMFDAVTVLLQRIWESIQAGWNWLQRLARTLIADISNALMPPRQAALAFGGSVAAAPPSTPANPPKAAPSPAQKVRSVPAPVAPPSAPTAATQPDPERAPATAQSDETALARMLASDDSQREVKFVRGWIAVELQRARKVSMFQFLTRGLGYGPRSRKSQGQLNVYASTATEPSETDRAIARSLLAPASPRPRSECTSPAS